MNEERKRKRKGSKVERNYFKTVPQFICAPESLLLGGYFFEQPLGEYLRDGTHRTKHTNIIVYLNYTVESFYRASRRSQAMHIGIPSSFLVAANFIYLFI